jgi:hypothetical protein
VYLAISKNKLISVHDDVPLEQLPVTEVLGTVLNPRGEDEQRLARHRHVTESSQQ